MKKITILFLIAIRAQLFAQDKCVSGNCITGVGKMVYADGSFYQGSFINGSRQGEGKMEAPDFVYTGNWKGGIYNGKGKLQKRSGVKREFYEEYNGTFVDGINNGEGSYIYFLGKDTSIVYKGNFKDGHYFGKGNLKVIPFAIYYSDSWIDNKTFTRGTEVRLDSKETYEGHYAKMNFERDPKLSEVDQRMAAIHDGKTTHGWPIKHTSNITDFAQGSFSKIVTWSMMGSFPSGFKRYFISPTLYSKKYPIPFGARFTFELVNSKNQLISRQVKYGNELECYFDVPKDGDYTIQAAYDFDGCGGCQAVSGIRVQFSLYSLDFTINK